MAHTHENLCPAASLIIVSKERRALILKHKKYKTWGIPGGHKEDGDTYYETLKSEIGDETGIAVKGLRMLHGDKLTDAGAYENRVSHQPTPFKNYLHEVDETHEHEDLIFAAYTPLELPFNPKPDESQDGFWADKTEVENKFIDKDLADIVIKAIYMVNSGWVRTGSRPY